MRRRQLSAVVGMVLALALAVVAFAPRPAGQAAQGQVLGKGLPYAGYVITNTMGCTVTVVSEWLAITPKTCGRVNAELRINVPTATGPGGLHLVKEIVPNRDFNVQAILLRNRTNLPVIGLGEGPYIGTFYAFGYGWNRANDKARKLTQAEFLLPFNCGKRPDPDLGNLCWQSDEKNMICNGDAGAPIVQNGMIVGMVTAATTTALPLTDCGTVTGGRGIALKQIQPWLDQKIKDADPFA